MVHGDDFVSAGERDRLKWLRKRLEDRFEIKTTVIGRGTEEVTEGRVLNRVIRMTKEGWENEADQRHAELIIQEQKLGDAKAVSTPGEEEKQHEKDMNDEPLSRMETHGYRGLAARANYLALDRPGIQYAVKEICRDMAMPTVRGKTVSYTHLTLPTKA